MRKVLEKMLYLWDALTAQIMNADKPPRKLEEFFNNDESKVVVQFLHGALAVFDEPILQLQVFYCLSV